MKTIEQKELLTSSQIFQAVIPDIDIDLLEVANQLASSATGLQKTALETKKPVFVSVRSLSKKLPGLEALSPDLTVFRLRGTESIFLADTLNVYEFDGATIIVSPDLEVLDGFEFVSYKTGINGHCVVSYDGLILKIAISVSDTHLDELIATSAKGIDGSGKPDASYLRKLPQPEIPIYSDDLPQKTALTIVASGKVSQRYETPLIDVTDPTGKLYKNVICNADLTAIVEKHGINSKFKILGKRARVNRDGQPIDSSGKVNTKKPSYIVQIQDMQGMDFSDLKI